MMPMLMMIMMPIMVMMRDGDVDDNREDNVDVHGLVLIQCHCHAAEQTLAQKLPDSKVTCETATSFPPCQKNEIKQQFGAFVSKNVYVTRNRV